MAKTDYPKKKSSPIVNISLINYNPAQQDEYSKKFMSPLIKGLLHRIQPAKAD